MSIKVAIKSLQSKVCFFDIMMQTSVRMLNILEKKHFRYDLKREPTIVW